MPKGKSGRKSRAISTVQPEGLGFEFCGKGVDCNVVDTQTKEWTAEGGGEKKVGPC
jgi:hypothetical protein